MAPRIGQGFILFSTQVPPEFPRSKLVLQAWGTVQVGAAFGVWTLTNAPVDETIAL